MSKKKPLDKEQARERRNQLLETAAAARLSINEGVREMRAISGLTQDEFARHREVSARVIKAIELGQANPTIATLNQIGKFFGLEVGFVPVAKTAPVTESPRNGLMLREDFEKAMAEVHRQMAESLAAFQEAARSLSVPNAGSNDEAQINDAAGSSSTKKRKPRSP
ncbi:helix-turn-helix domain-containing protein [Massilia sp. IC2-278]|uniref:helix-turn-helix domain-containing protein n=1 Tax=Massilia sp. IC2-278 TaxID=2887200 RepID=UPI001E4499B8|nr:helix-turn-helix domain-containing protein [Massilia sp. IC2-278]MCC2963354.1 helix-turn-helix domain-containing protein [Massilia sp. IC2-278]